jgi:hypothetical protein
VNLLAQSILLQVQQLPHMGEAVPAKWLAIREALDFIKQHRPCITQKEYFDLYQLHLDNDRVKALMLSRYLHDLGVFLHFQDHPLLSRLVILQNEWATEAVFKVLDDERTKVNAGYFGRSDCQRIWADSTYADMHPELLALMEQFELCYKLPDRPSETWLLPQLLCPSTPETLRSWVRADDLVLTYQYDFLPKGLINRLMVRMHRFVRQPQLSWASGAYFEQAQTELLAQITAARGQEIELRARGPERKALLSVIASDLDALNSSFDGLKDKVRKLVPCICQQCRQSTNPTRFTEQELLERKQVGKATIECKVRPFDNVSVHELLDGIHLDGMPAWAKRTEIDPVITERISALTNNESASEQRTISIFLASSSELIGDRDAFDLYFRQQNDRWMKKGIYLKIERWEILSGVMSESRLQDEYNEKIQGCEIFVSLFQTKAGKFTEEEFDVAHATFQKTGKPLIYAYFRETSIPASKHSLGA